MCSPFWTRGGVILRYWSQPARHERRQRGRNVLTVECSSNTKMMRVSFIKGARHPTIMNVNNPDGGLLVRRVCNPFSHGRFPYIFWTGILHTYGTERRSIHPATCICCTVWTLRLATQDSLLKEGHMCASKRRYCLLILMGLVLTREAWPALDHPKYCSIGWYQFLLGACTL